MRILHLPRLIGAESETLSFDVWLQLKGCEPSTLHVGFLNGSCRISELRDFYLAWLTRFAERPESHSYSLFSPGKHTPKRRAIGEAHRRRASLP